MHFRNGLRVGNTGVGRLIVYSAILYQLQGLIVFESVERMNTYGVLIGSGETCRGFMVSSRN